MNPIKLLFMDVDGTLTDGKIYMGAKGEELKAFDIKDGYGINEILPEFGIIPVIITGRCSEIVENRAKELHIAELYQGRHDKLETMIKIIEKYDCTIKNAAYIGDDILDLKCMLTIKEAGGFVGCPYDAVGEIKKLADFISTKNGGDGAVREFIDWLLEKGKKGLCLDI